MHKKRYHYAVQQCRHVRLEFRHLELPAVRWGIGGCMHRCLHVEERKRTYLHLNYQRLTVSGGRKGGVYREPPRGKGEKCRLFN